MASFYEGDYAAVLEPFTRYAKQGDANAQYYLASMYALGMGVPRNLKTAAEWARLSAEQGNATAQTTFGLMHVSGEGGITQDITRAHMWLSLASSGGDRMAASLQSRVAKQMTPDQLEEAQKLARECVAKDYKGC
tara:strand:+ start:85 stop:489 length:405 start_codon:yes stop_codon:yes gene_type:complete